MFEINITVFKTAIDIMALFARTESGAVPVYVVETDRTVAFRPFLRQLSVGLVVPKSRPSSRGLSYTASELSQDPDPTGVPLGAFLSVDELARRLRGVRTTRRRGDSTLGEAIFEPDNRLYLYEPGISEPVVSRVRWTSDTTPPRLPVYLTVGGAGNRVSALALNAIGQAGRKLAPTGTGWSYDNGRWEIKNSQGSTLRVATWPTNP